MQHVAKFRNMVKQLLFLGENIYNLTIMSKLSANLTPKFSTLQKAWDSVDPARQTLENLKERLIKEKRRLEAVGDETAFAAMRNNNAKAGGSDSKEDSKSKNSSKDKEEERKARREKKKQNGKCFACQEKGHQARVCPARKQNKDGGNESESRASSFIVVSSKSAGNG